MDAKATGKERGPRWRGRAWRALRLAMILVLSLAAGVVVLLSAALAVLQTGWAREHVLAVVLRAVNASILGQVEVERLEGHLPFGAILVGVRLTDLAGREVGRLDRAEARLSVMALLSRTVRLEGMVVEGLRATLRDDEGRDRLLDAFRAVTPSPAGPPSRWAVELPDATLEGSFDWAPGPGAPRLRDLRVTASVRYADGTLRWHPVEAEARLVNVSADRVRLDSAGSLGPDGVRILHLSVQAGPHGAAIHGQVVLGHSPPVDLVIDRGRLDLDGLGRLLAWPAERPVPVRGVVDVTGRVHGTFGALRTDLDVVTGAGALQLAGTAGIEAGVASCDLSLAGHALRPGGVLPSLPPGLAMDLAARLEGRGNPLETGSANATVSVVLVDGADPLPRALDLRAAARNGVTSATLRTPGSGDPRLAASFWLYRPPPGLADLRVDMAGIAVGPLAELAGLPGAAGTVEALAAHARAFVEADGRIRGSGWMRVDMTGLRAPPAVGVPVRVDRIGVRVDADWTGEGLPTGRVRAGLEGVLVAGVAASRAAADVDLSPEGDRLRARGSLRAQRMRFGRQASLARLDLRLDLSMARDGGVPGGRLAGRLEGVELGGRALRRVDVVARWDPGMRVAFEAAATGDPLVLDLSAEARLPVAGQRLSVEVRRLLLLDDGYGLRLAPGAVARLAASGAVTVEGLRFGGPVPGTRDLVLSGAYEPSTRAVRADVTASDLDLREAHAFLLHLLGPSRIAPDPPPRGTVRLHGVVTGTLAEPTATADFRLADLDLGGLSVSRAGGTATLDRRGLLLDMTAASGAGGSVEVRVLAPLAVSLRPLGARWSTDGPASVDLTLRAFDLSDLRAVLGSLAPPMGGRVEGFVRVEGSLAEPRGTVALTLDGVDFDTVKDVSGRLDATVETGRTRALLHLTRPGDQSLRLQADLPLDLPALLARGGAGLDAMRRRLAGVPFRVLLTMDGLRTANVPFVALLGGGWLRRAVLDGDLLLNGTLSRLQASGHLDARDVQVGMQRTNLTASIRPEGPGATVVVALADTATRTRFADARVDLPAGLGPLLVAGGGAERLLRDERLRVRLETDRLPAAVARKMSGELGRLVEALVPAGLLTARVLARGGEGGLSGEAEAVLEVPEGTEGARRGIARSVRLDAKLTPMRTQVSGKAVQPEGGSDLEWTADLGIGTAALTGGGRAGGAADGIPLQAHLAARAFRLDELASALPSVFGPGRGVLDGDLRMEGSTRAPRLSGHMTAAFADLNLVSAGLRLKDVTFAVEAGPDGIELAPLHLVSGKGTLDLTLALRAAAPGAGVSRIDGRVTMDRFRVLDRRDARVSLTSDIVLDGTLARPGVRGTVTVDQARIRPAIGERSVHGTGLPEGVVFVGPGGPPDAAALPVASGRLPVDLDLVIVAPPKSIRVASSLVDTFLAADLAVRTREGELELEGAITVVKGTLSLYGRTFDLQPDSAVVFDGSPGINPRLQIKAEYDMRNVDLSALGMTAGPDSRIFVEVSGTGEEPEVNVRSAPHMAQADIVAIIALGAPVGLTSGQQTAVHNQTTKLVAGLATGSLARAFKVDLPIDVLEVGTAPGAESGTEIAVGKRITRDLLVVYRANVGTTVKDRNRNEVSVEYDITRYLEVRTSYGDAGQGALDLLFRWRY